jgi:hypothetical protein
MTLMDASSFFFLVFNRHFVIAGRAESVQRIAHLEGQTLRLRI